MSDLATVEWPGTSGFTLLLAHATGFCKEVWRPLIEELRSCDVEAPALAWDFRSHGSSPPAARPVDWWALSEDVVRIASVAPAPRVGIGHSMGAATLAMAEVTEPGLFDLLVLIEPIIFPGPYRRDEDGPMSVVARKRRTWFSGRADALANFAEKPAFAGWDTRALEAYVDGGFMQAPHGLEIRCRPDDEADMYAAATAHGAWDRLAEVRCPVVVIVGEHSDTHDEAFTAQMVERFGGPAEWVVVEESGHTVPMERPAALADLVATAVGRVLA